MNRMSERSDACSCGPARPHGCACMLLRREIGRLHRTCAAPRLLRATAAACSSRQHLTSRRAPPAYSRAAPRRWRLTRALFGCGHGRSPSACSWLLPAPNRGGKPCVGSGTRGRPREVRGGGARGRPASFGRRRRAPGRRRWEIRAAVRLVAVE